jgi:hypothetical protein
MTLDNTFLGVGIAACVLLLLINHFLLFPILAGFLDVITYQSCGFVAEAFNEWSQVLEVELQNMGIKTIGADVSTDEERNVVCHISKPCLGKLKIIIKSDGISEDVPKKPKLA